LRPVLNPITSLHDFHSGKEEPLGRILRTLTNHETEWLLLANALTPREYILDLYTLLNMLPACSFPGYHGTGAAREVPLRKYVIRDMRQALKAFQLWQIEADTLCSGTGT
jgi:hypothetical protein